MCKKALIVVLSGISLVSTLAWGDYITPEHNIEIADNVYARESAARRINIYKLTDKVVELYNQDIKNMSEGITLVEDKNNCIHLFINTKNGKKNFINQIIVDEECSND